LLGACHLALSEQQDSSIPHPEWATEEPFGKASARLPRQRVFRLRCNPPRGVPDLKVAICQNLTLAHLSVNPSRGPQDSACAPGPDTYRPCSAAKAGHNEPARLTSRPVPYARGDGRDRRNNRHSLRSAPSPRVGPDWRSPRRAAQADAGAVRTGLRRPAHRKRRQYEEKAVYLSPHSMLLHELMRYAIEHGLGHRTWAWPR
jgi:hypothetical protein